MRKLLLILLISSFTFGAKYYSSHNAAGNGAGTTVDPFTLQELADNTNAGDTGIVMATGIYTISTTIDWDNASAVTVTNPAMIFGGAANGDIDGTRPEINGSGLGASQSLFYLNVSALSVKFKSLIIRNATAINIEISSNTNVSFIVFDSCLIDSSDDDGILTRETSNSHIRFINCNISHNVGNGYTSEDFGDSRYPADFLNCIVSYNGQVGLYLPGNNTLSPLVEGCRIFKNNKGIFWHENGHGKISHNLISMNTSHGIELDAATYGLLIYNNTITFNGGYGIQTNTAGVNEFSLINNNNVYSNTSGDIDINSGVLPGNFNTTTDPLYTDTTTGSEDFAPATGSPLIDNGFGATN